MKSNGGSENQSSYTITAYPGAYLPGAYKNFISSTWMKSFRNGNDYYKLIDSDAYYVAYAKGITSLLKDPRTMLKLALLTEEKDVLLGYSVARYTTDANILDYIYVKKDFRKLGIGRRLLPKNTTIFTHLTRTGMKLWPTKMPGALFIPFA